MTHEATIHFSTMTGKLKGIPAINTNTLSNSFCSRMRKTDAVCKVCYSAAMLSGSRKNCVPAFERNSVTLAKPLETIPTINAAFFRFDGHGELINYINLENYARIAVGNPHCTFALWTKRSNLVRRYLKENAKPANLIFIYSNPTIGTVRKVPVGFDKVFNVVPETEHTDKQNCTGQKCMDCLECYKVQGKSVIIEAVKIRS